MTANKIRLMILCLLLVFISTGQAMAQRENPMFYKELQLQPKKKYTLQSLTREIQRQTGISFSYNAARISPDTKIKVKTDRITVKQMLAYVKNKTGIGYKVISGTHIVYTEGPATKMSKKDIQKNIAKNKAKRRSQKPLQQLAENTAVKPVGRDSVAGQQIMIIGDSAVVAYYFSGGMNAGAGYGGNSDVRYPVLRDATYDNGGSDYGTDKKESSLARNTRKDDNGGDDVAGFFKRNTLIGVGLAADETYYLNPTVKLGFDFLHGIISYNLGSFPQWRYGVGSAVKLNDNWRLGLSVTGGGAISNAYNITGIDTIFVPNPDTILQDPVYVQTNTPLRVQSKLTRITFSAEYSLGRNFLLGGGLIFNRLRTDYSSNGNPVKLSDILPVGYDADANYRTIKPPYLLGNTYSASETSNIKTWVGFQLSLIYRFSLFN